MKADFSGNGLEVMVTLSRRNLVTLLDKLDRGVSGGPSACTIFTDYGITVDGEEAIGFLVVKAESDQTHYHDRPTPGPMHPDTESRLHGGGVMDGPQGLRIEQMFAFIAVDPDDETEGIIGVQTPEGWIPMVGADMEMVDQLRIHAVTVAAVTQSQVKLCLFSQRQDLETLNAPT